MGGLCCCNKTPAPVVREIKLLCLGLDGSGKTTALKLIKGENPVGVMSTNGFSKIELDYSPTFRIIVYDVGGGARIRDIWVNYYAEVHGVIFLINLADEARKEEMQRVLSEVLQHKDNQTKPFLFLLNNKEDGEIDDVETINSVNMHNVAKNNSIFPFVGHFQKIDKNNPPIVPVKKQQITKRLKKEKSSLLEPFCDFIDRIITDYVALNNKVRQAELALKMKQDKDKQDRKMRLMQEERHQRNKDIQGLEGRNSLTQTNGRTNPRSPPSAPEPHPQGRNPMGSLPSPSAVSHLSSDVFVPENPDDVTERLRIQNDVTERLRIQNQRRPDYTNPTFDYQNEDHVIMRNGVIDPPVVPTREVTETPVDRLREAAWSTIFHPDSGQTRRVSRMDRVRRNLARWDSRVGSAVSDGTAGTAMTTLRTINGNHNVQT